MVPIFLFLLLTKTFNPKSRSKKALLPFIHYIAYHISNNLLMLTSSCGQRLRKRGSDEARKAEEKKGGSERERERKRRRFG